MDSIFLNFRVRQAQAEATDAKSRASDLAITIAQLEDKVDYLSVVCAALAELLSEVGFSESMLMQKIEEIDLRDGRKDGRYNPTKSCGSCGRTLAARHLTCIYCGQPYDGS